MVRTYVPNGTYTCTNKYNIISKTSATMWISKLLSSSLDNGLEHRKRLSKFWIMDWSRLLQTPNLRLDNHLSNRLSNNIQTLIQSLIQHQHQTSNIQTPNACLSTKYGIQQHPNSKLQTLHQQLLRLRPSSHQLREKNCQQPQQGIRSS
jgi:hypothetical protein